MIGQLEVPYFTYRPPREVFLAHRYMYMYVVAKIYKVLCNSYITHTRDVWYLLHRST